jgi:hypothetical protein
MAEADWSLLTGILDINTVDRGVTAGMSPPNGGGSFVYGFNSLAEVAGAVGIYVDIADFNPCAKGGSIRAALKRGAGGGATGFSPFLFIGAQGNGVSDQGYLLGLSDEDPHRILLRKGSLAAGIAGLASTTGLLMQGSNSYSQNTWLHLRLDMIVNDTGDVVLKAYESDLDVNAVTAPSWSLVPGMEAGFIDDALGVNSGSAPFTSGYVGLGFAVEKQTRRGFFDHVEVLRQT